MVPKEDILIASSNLKATNALPKRLTLKGVI